MAHVTSVHYAVPNPFIYTIIFNFTPLQGGFFYSCFLCMGRYNWGSFDCPNSLVVKHVLGKDESQVRFLLRAPEMHHLLGVCLILLRSCMFNTLPS